MSTTSQSHVIIHKSPDGSVQSAFPCIAKLQNGDLVTVYRESLALEGGGHTHGGQSSWGVLIRSKDEGKTWHPSTKVTISNIPLGLGNIGITALSDRSLITHYTVIGPNFVERVKAGESTQEDGVFVRKSNDNGYTWSAHKKVDVSPLNYGVALRCPILELKDGTLLMPLCGSLTLADMAVKNHSACVVKSRDGGETWGASSIIASDPSATFNYHEISLLEFPDGDILAMVRVDSAAGGGHMYQSISEDGGHRWSTLERVPMWGFPGHLLRLRSGATLCAYGYRRPPYGVRAVRSLDGGKTWDVGDEKVLRDDGSDGDIGYPCSVELDDDTLLTVYYFHRDDGIRFIGGTFYKGW